jgi:hypothetical protein
MEVENNINDEQEVKLICLENFYKNPHEIREHLIKRVFDYNEKEKLFELKININLNKIKNVLQKLIGKNITTLIGCFIINASNDCLVNAIDNNIDYEWTAILFLTPFAKLNSGIKLYKKDISGSELDKPLLTIEDEIGNIFNRLVIFKSKYYNSIGSFGININNGNLYQKLLFSTN